MAEAQLKISPITRLDLLEYTYSRPTSTSEVPAGLVMMQCISSDCGRVPQKSRALAGGKEKSPVSLTRRSLPASDDLDSIQ